MIGETMASDGTQNKIKRRAWILSEAVQLDSVARKRHDTTRTTDAIGKKYENISPPFRSVVRTRNMQIPIHRHAHHRRVPSIGPLPSENVRPSDAVDCSAYDFWSYSSIFVHIWRMCRYLAAADRCSIRRTSLGHDPTITGSRRPHPPTSHRQAHRAPPMTIRRSSR